MTLRSRVSLMNKKLKTFKVRTLAAAEIPIQSNRKLYHYLVNPL